MAGHTPTPWKHQPNEEEVIAPHVCYTGDIGGVSDEDGEFIVRACNAHEDLLAACEAAALKFDEMYASRTGRMPEAVELVRKAIAKAKG